MDESRQRLKAHFDAPTSSHGQRWDALWANGSFLPWDRGAPSPALADLLAQRGDLVGGALIDAGEDKDVHDGDGDGAARQRRKALVPGCGRGYDAFLLAARGWDVVGLEVSEMAVRLARSLGEGIEQGEVGGEVGGVYDAGSAGKGSVRFEVGDFFELGEGWMGKWDFIWDYTVSWFMRLACKSVVEVCFLRRPAVWFETMLILRVKFLSALPPSLRPAWALQMSKLLSPNGRLVCLEFPTYKDPALGGPPWALPPPVYEGHLGRPGQELPYDEKGAIVPDRENLVVKGGLERVEHFMPERTFEVGKGTDHISVWRFKR